MRPCAAAVDAEGCLEWLALPVGPRCGWLQPDGAMADEAAAQATPPLETLEAHLALLHTPQVSPTLTLALTLALTLEP